MAKAKKFSGAAWDEFDAEALFPAPQLYTNKITKIDQKQMTKVDASDEYLGEYDSGDLNSDQSELGDTYSDAPIGDEGHVDEMLEMEGETLDDREVKADQEVDERTDQEDEVSSSDQEAPSENSSKNDLEASPEANESEQSEFDESEAQADESEGAEKPIQKESEGVEEVAEATSKTSEDVHGGDEATKDIEDSPNAADDGQNPDNQGAQSGEDGEEGEGEGEASGGLSASEDWESQADHVAFSQRLTEELAEVASIKPETAGGGGAAIDYSGENLDSTNLRSIFFKTRELITKLLSEEDVTTRKHGNSRWWAEELVKATASFRHKRIAEAKFDRPKENNIVFFMDVSGSVSSLASLFMAIMGGAAGLPGVRIVTGSEAHAENEIVVDKPFRSVEKAISFFQENVHGNDGWSRNYEHQFEPGVVEYLKEHNLYNSSTTCVFFGDMQGVHFETTELRKIVRKCKCLWLFTDEPGNYTHTGDLPKAIEAKLPIVYNVRSAKVFAKGVRRLQTIRPGMQIVP